LFAARKLTKRVLRKRPAAPCPPDIRLDCRECSDLRGWGMTENLNKFGS
jgi:hypothetical protein